ncbi:hypothetical protein C8R46DRAFT_1313219 [Mycena filopes]|nr:hypothetical protein C8R46DRAFT_1313219 [Mycena filopes]
MVSVFTDLHHKIQNTLILDHDRARITAFDAQILELERSLSKLRAVRKVVQARLDAFKYPVLTLPNEVVGEIFTQFVPTYPLCPPLVGPGSPILLTQICHLWREIAVRMAVLWKAIDVSSVSSVSRLAAADIAHICGVWLKRSLSAPLSMRIGYGERFLNTIIAHRERWEYLEIDLLQEDLHAIGGPMPFLRHLDLAFEEPSNDDVVPVALVDLPLLRSVILDDNTLRTVGIGHAGM